MNTKPIVYTEDYVKKELASLLEELLANDDILTVAELIHKKRYSSQRLSEWYRKYSDDIEISESYTKMKDILEARLVGGALRGRLNVSMTIFNLKHNYGWTSDRNGIATDRIVVSLGTTGYSHMQKSTIDA